ncbi:MAG TPA: VIT domain-containing protein [Planctomycetota bacterium]|nr:VIT domain-containing protein [Planctomycetota bacterium]
MRTTRSHCDQEILCALAIPLLLCAIAAHGATPSTANTRPALRAAMVLSDATLPPLHLNSHSVNVEIHGRTARVITESVYHNSTPRDVEATYIFPLPEGATIERFTMWMDGEPVEGKVAEKERARRTYVGIVNRGKDPGLVEQIAEGVFQYRIFPVKAQSDQKIRMEYSQVLPLSTAGDSLQFTYPLLNQSPRGAKETVARNFVVAVTMEMEGAIASIESPTHTISKRITPGEPAKGNASIEEAYSGLDRDFSLNITLKERAGPLSSLAFRPVTSSSDAPEEGTVMLFITPQLPEGEVLPPKDVVLVMDTSGSMEGVKIVQARNALLQALDRLRTGDRFAIVTFSDVTTCFRTSWSNVNAGEIAEARQFVAALAPGGGTNIEAGIRSALSYPLQPGRLKQVLFATDGMPTIGNTNVNALSDLVSSGNGQAEARFFTFGIGYDVNTVLLDRLSTRTRGDRVYVRENENIETKVARLCDKINAPVLSDVTVEFSSNLQVDQVYPPVPGDLYLGRQTVIAARYKSPGTGRVIVRGKRNGNDVVIQAPLDLPEKTLQATSYLPRQWALRKVGFLLDQMRLNGENKELKDEVIRLGTLHGIVTPYTSYLALERPDRDRFDAESKRLNQNNAGLSPSDHFETIHKEGAFGNPGTSDIVGAGGAGTGSGWSAGNGAGVDTAAGNGTFGQRSGGGRRLMVKRHGGSRATENGTDAALRWLASCQEADGHWNSRKYGTKERVDTAVTSLALLAFLGAGHTEKVGEYSPNVQRAVAWLLAQQNADGRILDLNEERATIDETIPTVALSTLALAEAAAMSNMPQTRTAAQKAVDYCTLKFQSRREKDFDGFGFTEGGKPNLPATVWFTSALKSAKVAGLKIDAANFDGIISYLDRVQQKQAGDVVLYPFAEGEEQPRLAGRLAAMGTVARSLLGWKSAELTPSAQHISTLIPKPEWNDQSDLQTWYFMTLCMFQQGRDLWKNWNDALKPTLLNNQEKQGDLGGSWLAAGPMKDHFGRVGATALSALNLEIYYRYVALRSSEPAARAAGAPARVAPAAPSGKAAVDYSEYIRDLIDGNVPQKP